MRNTFPEFNRKNESELSSIWNNGIIILDTNVLLDLYRYSDSTKESFLNLFRKLKDKIIIPYQVALEFHKNRYSVINEHINNCNQYKSKLVDFEKKTNSNNIPPFFSDSINSSFKELVGRITSEIDSTISKYEDFYKNDLIYESLDNIFKENITQPFTPEELLDIQKNGNNRFQKNIPPGFLDKNKPEDNRYGDLINWEHAKKIAKEKNSPIIFVTNETGEDWWFILSGKTIGPRPEMLYEFKRETNCDLLLYKSERFLEFGWVFTNDIADQQAIKEVEKMKRFRSHNDQIAEKLEEKFGNNNIDQLLAYNNDKERIKDINQRIEKLKTEEKYVNNVEGINLIKIAYLNLITSKITSLENELSILLQSEFNNNE